MAHTLDAYRPVVDRLVQMDDGELDDREQHDDAGWSGTLVEAVEAKITSRFALA
jgi:hypothetical protein